MPVPESSYEALPLRCGDDPRAGWFDPPMNIFVSGSLAYDRIMDFQGHFADHIIPEKIHVINLSFTVNGLKENFGGTAGNIAYGLSLLGERPLVLATIGRDYHRYFDWLTGKGISLDGIRIIPEELTAGAYITTDLSDNQITGFNPGAMKSPFSYDFSNVDASETIAIVGPGNMEDMMRCAGTYRRMGIDYIFDPGQSLTMWNGPDLVGCIDGSRILISNDYELELICSKTGLDTRRLLERTGTIITTLGEYGSRVSTPDLQVAIPPVGPVNVVDPTGAGDAYRAGLLKGLVGDLGVEQSARMGSVCASFAVESYGTQEYSFTPAEFQQRLAFYDG
jgi:adenosine kinase